MGLFRDPDKKAKKMIKDLKEQGFDLVNYKQRKSYMEIVIFIIKGQF